jgi:hypothetical protein
MEIGAVVAVQGTVKAQREGEEEELLGRGAPIFLHDLINVAEDSRAQLKLTDGSLLNLIPETLYRIDTYVFKRSKEEDQFGAELMKGGLRGITGSIAKVNPAGVSIKTPTATMGLRGTIFEVMIQDNRTYFGCESGEISVSNKAGLVFLGPYVERQFGVVLSDKQQPQTLAKRPDALNLNKFIPPRGGCQ